MRECGACPRRQTSPWRFMSISTENKTLVKTRKLMSKSKIILLALCAGSILTLSSPAQTTTNGMVLPATILESLESLTGQIIVKGTAPIGSLSAPGVVISVTGKADTLVSAGQNVYGIAVGLKFDGQPEDRTVIDYDELDLLLGSLDYLRKVNWSEASLSNFDANSSFDVNYTTKAGLRVAAFSSKRAGQIEFSLRTSRMEKGLLLTPQQFAQLQTLLTQAKTKLDAIRKA